MLLVTIRDLESQHSLFNGKWMQVAKLQSQRKSLSTPEEPYALDVLIITIQVGREAQSPAGRKNAFRGIQERRAEASMRVILKCLYCYSSAFHGLAMYQ